MKFCEKIIYLRKLNNLTQEDLAEKLNVSRQAVGKWETENNMPDLDKIRQMAKIFEVSFDYLLDDTIDTFSTGNTNENIIIKYRGVFDSKISIDQYQASYDHGYPSGSPVTKKNPKAEEIFNRKKSNAETYLNRKGYIDLRMLQDDAVIFFGYNMNKHTICFYYGESIQFVCPIENIINVQITNSGRGTQYGHSYSGGIGYGSSGLFGGLGVRSRSSHREPVSHRLTLSYFNENGINCIYNLTLMCYRNYAETISRGLSSYAMLLDIISKRTAVILNQLQQVILSYKAKAEMLRNNRQEFPYFNPNELYNDLKKETTIKEENKKNQEDEEKKKAKKINIICVIIAIILVIVAFWFFMVSGLYKDMFNL